MTKKTKSEKKYKTKKNRLLRGSCHARFLVLHNEPPDSLCYFLRAKLKIIKNETKKKLLKGDR